MKTWRARFASVLTVGIFAAWSAVGVAFDDPPPPDIETVMKKVNSNKDGIHKALGADLKASNVDWDAATKKIKVYHGLVTALNKFDPPKGDKKSWDKLTKEYAANAKSLLDAAQRKDKAAATATHGKISRSCMACHNAHRG